MPYGILVKNGNNRVQIDSETGYPTLYQSSSGTVANNVVNMNSIATDSLLFARPVATTGTAYIQKDTTNYLSSGAPTLEYKVYKETTSGLVVPNTGYGLNIYNSSSQIIFSGTSSSYVNNLEILATGKFGFDPDTQFDIVMPSSTYALSTGKVFVLMNTTVSIGVDNSSSYYYEYRFDDSAYGTIRLYAATIYITGGTPPYGFPVVSSYPSSSGNAYVIAYIRS